MSTTPAGRSLSIACAGLGLLCTLARPVRASEYPFQDPDLSPEDLGPARPVTAPGSS